MKLAKTSGLALAAAAAIFVVNSTAPTVEAKSDYTVKCFGVNSCKGHGACKSAGNACKGHNGCGGQGFKLMKKSQCDAKKGKTSRG